VVAKSLAEGIPFVTLLLAASIELEIESILRGKIGTTQIAL
jgi:hypothetical protein